MKFENIDIFLIVITSVNIIFAFLNQNWSGLCGWIMALLLIFIVAIQQKELEDLSS